MINKKIMVLFLVLVVTIFSLIGAGCMPLTITQLEAKESVANDDTTTPTTSEDDYYQSYSFDGIGICKWPDFIGGNYNLGACEREYYITSTFSELKNIFESCTGYEITEYFNAETFNENYVLCVVRDETTGTAEIKYSNFRVNGLELSIEETFIGGGAEVVSRYLDFVVIPRQSFSKGNYCPGLEYYWINNEITYD